MIRWSTPTLPVIVRGANFVATGCHVVVSFAQGCRRLDVEDPPMSFDQETGNTTIFVSLTQLQTAGFCAGAVDVQVNAIDRAGYRVPTDRATFLIGSNLLDHELEPPGGAPEPTPGGIVPTGSITITENGEFDVTNYATAIVNVPNAPSGNIVLSPNFTDKDISQYATATSIVAVLVTYDLNGVAGTRPSKEPVIRMSVVIDGSTRPTRPNLLYPYRMTASKIWWYQYGSYIEIPQGKKFDGWSTSPTATEGHFQLLEPINEDTTVYAVWVDA